MKFLYVFLVLTVCFSVKCEDESKLLSFEQIFRHGARTPILFYKDDPYKDRSYWDGLKKGHLTEEGKQQLVELGQYIRQRYADFIPRNYSDEFITVTSVSPQRNRESAENYLKGLFPEQSDLSNAVHVDNSVLRTFVYPTYIFQYLKLVRTEQHFKSFIEEHKEIFEYIQDHAKMTIPVPEKLLYSYFLWDALSIEARQNLTLPEWTKTVFPEKITSTVRMFSKTMCYNQAMKKIAARPFLNSVIKHFDKVAEKSTSQKVLLYCGHDTNLMCFLNTFGIYEHFKYDVPAFASSIIFELREKKGKKFVNVYYKVDQNLHPITFKGCQFDCDYNEFKGFFSNVRMDDSNIHQNKLE